jgi:hypothetical protein
MSKSAQREPEESRTGNVTALHAEPSSTQPLPKLKRQATRSTRESAHVTQIGAGMNANGLRRHRAGSGADGQDPPSADSRGSLEGRYLTGPGKPLNRQITELKDRRADAAQRVTESRGAADRAQSMLEEREARHRGGDRPWPLRLLIPVGVIAEAVTAFVGMEVLVPSLTLALGLAALAALAGTGMACVLANRRLNRLPVPGTARVLEGIFVAVLTVLRYDSLHVQGADFAAATGGAALAALISALALLGIEEVLVETHTFSIFAGKLRVSCRRGQCARAVTRLGRTQARLEATAEKLQQHFLDFLLKQDTPLDEARQRAVAFRRTLVDSEG